MPDYFSPRQMGVAGGILRIANPLFDVVFRYLLEDNELARILLSTLFLLDRHFSP